MKENEKVLNEFNIKNGLNINYIYFRFYICLIIIKYKIKNANKIVKIIIRKGLYMILQTKVILNVYILTKKMIRRRMQIAYKNSKKSVRYFRIVFLLWKLYYQQFV